MLIEHARHADFTAMATGNLACGVQRMDDYISRSWSRCMEYGLDPGGSAHTPVITQKELCERQQALEELLHLAKPELANLHAQLPSSGYSVLLSDLDGIIISHIGDPHSPAVMTQHGILPGAIWTEQHQGTNGTGTCLVEKRPLVIRRREHFLERNTELTCAAAPVFNGYDELIAILNVSTLAREPEQNMLHLVGMAAQAIENQIFLRQCKNYCILRFHPRYEMVGMFCDCRMAYDEDGRIIALNRSALFELGMHHHSDAIGRHITEIFDRPVEALVHDPLPSALPRLIFTTQGKQLFATLLAPMPGNSSAPPMPASCQPAQTQSLSPGFENIHFGDPQMAKNVRIAERLLHIDIPILLHGETGTGKEVFAKAVHLASEQGFDRPFVAVNCTALPESLIESELFGYQHGAFTGASKDGYRGKILQANGGTLFLDEIGDMSLHLQARLLRVLEEREVTPLGSETPVKVDIKLISASHRNLEELVSQGKFREDLYYRLRGIQIELPPLRCRQDIEPLLWHLFEQESKPLQVPAIEPGVIHALKAYHWPGNIRQARSIVRLLLALREENCIAWQDLPSEIKAPPHSPDDPALLEQQAEDDWNVLKAAERTALLTQLEHNSWNIACLAKQLRVSRSTLYRKMKRMNIRSPK